MVSENTENRNKNVKPALKWFLFEDYTLRSGFNLYKGNQTEG